MMKRCHFILIVASVLLAGTARAQSDDDALPEQSPEAWAEQMAASVMERNPTIAEEWEYELGVLLKGIMNLWERTDNDAYFDYVKKNIDQFVAPDGAIRTYEMDDYNLDKINSGKMLFPLYDVTGDERYQTAAHTLREQLAGQPRTSEGGFWHKKRYTQQMWLDGLYMAAPFYTKYAATFGEPEGFDDVTRQFLLAARHMRDPATGLYYHGWDEDRAQIWADPETGLSENFWGRAMGWYAMAMVDALDDLPEDHPDRAQIIRLFSEMMDAVADVQDPVTGVWYQVLDMPNREGNYLEASASVMFTYALAKGVRKGYLDESFAEVAHRAYDGVLDEFVTMDDEGLVDLNRINSVAGLGGDDQRDGSFAYYISEPVVTNAPKGVGSFLMASVQMAMLEEALGS